MKLNVGDRPMNQHLILFDMDGTLTDTHGFSTDCYVAAIRDAFDLGDREISTDWFRRPALWQMRFCVVRNTESSGSGPQKKKRKTKK